MDSQVETRDYQLELFEMAKERNLIICLPTGSGKTWVSLLLARHYLPLCIEKKKKIVFLANTVHLVDQQYHYFKTHLPAGRVSQFVGYMNVDSWNSELWQAKLSESEVLVMSSQVFKDILNKEITLDQTALLIFDECHHADKSHCMNHIMDDYRQKLCDNDSQKLQLTPVYELPRILGLTATIIKGIPKRPVSEEIKRMEETLNARAITYHEYEKVLKYSTSAMIRLKAYRLNEGEEGVCHGILKQLIGHLSAMRKATSEHSTVASMLKLHQVPKDRRYNNKKSLSIELGNHVQEVIDILDSLGPACATIGAQILLVAASAKLKGLSQLNEILLYQLYAAGLSEFVALIEKVGEKDLLSPKMEALLQELGSKRLSDQLCGIIFVERKLDCQVLHWYFQHLAEKDERWASFKSKTHFVTATENDGVYVSESVRVTHRMQKEIIIGFREKKYNLLFSTAVLEEGLDVPSCNFIIRLDKILSYRSFIQSMGRARNKDSEFIIFINETCGMQEFNSIVAFQRCCTQLADALRDNVLHVGEEIDCTQRVEELEPFCPGGQPNSPRISSADAIQLINCYVSLLGESTRDMIGANVPIAWYDQVRDSYGMLRGYQAFLVLPKKSLLKEKIVGKIMETKSGAKRAVFLEACILLHAAGGLDENLRPLRCRVDPKILEFFEVSQPKAQATGLPKGWTRKAIPDCFQQFGSVEGQRTYTLYEVSIQLFSPDGQEKEKVFDYTTKKFTTGILSLTSLDMIPPFKLESGLGVLRVELRRLPHVQPITLYPEVRKKLRSFQRNLFLDVLGLNFKCTAQQSEPNTPLWVVPIRRGTSGTTDVIDFSLMEELEGLYTGNGFAATYGKAVPENERRTPENDEGFVSKGGYEDAVVIPWHKGLGELHCVVGVLRDASPLSPFEDSAQTSFADFYETKYLTRPVINNQPLIRCYPMGKTLDYLKVKVEEKCKRSAGDKAILTFIPELVRAHVLPASIYSQAKMLPTILHRISRFLLAMELGAKISGTAGGLRRPSYKAKDRWGYNEYVEEVNKANPGHTPTSFNENVLQMDVNTTGLKRRQNSNMAVNLKYVNPNTVTLEHLEDSYMESKRPKRDTPVWNSMGVPHDHVPLHEIFKPHCGSGVAHAGSGTNLIFALPDIESLGTAFNGMDIVDTSMHPPIYEILEAITIAGAQDRISLERLEVIGDSFLKYSVTLFIYGMFPDYDEGRLTDLRGKLISNANLKRLGDAKGLGPILAGGSFFPDYSFLPPSFIVNEKCALAGMEAGMPLNVFHGLTPDQIQVMSHEELVREAKGGQLTSAPKVTNYGYSKLKEKDVADCVEALIGAYFMSGGEAGALHAMSWVGIRGPDRNGLPVKLGNQKVYASPRKDTRRLTPSIFIRNIIQIEELLQYKFKDPWLLVEALTHPNDVMNDVTDCFQRLEFLGDAVLDFLITSHIYNNSAAKTPGEVTDLRSALVNNVTFGSLSIRYGFHKHLMHTSREMQRAIDEFAILQEGSNHQVTGQFIRLTEFEAPTARDVEVPKVLGDIFESICGAVFVDSEMSLDTTWQIYYRLLKNEIEIFSKNCPKSPIREMMEKGYTKEIFQVETGGMMGCRIKTADGVFTGFGSSKRSAMDAAAKLTQRSINEKMPRENGVEGTMVQKFVHSRLVKSAEL